MFVIIQVLGLDICADTMVGNEMLRGISGGQRKRVTTGEMLDNVFFLLSKLRSFLPIVKTEVFSSYCQMKCFFSSFSTWEWGLFFLFIFDWYDLFIISVVFLFYVLWISSSPSGNYYYILVIGMSLKIWFHWLIGA